MRNHKHQWRAHDTLKGMQVCAGERCHLLRVEGCKSAPRRALRLIPELCKSEEYLAVWIKRGVTLHRAKAHWSIWCTLDEQQRRGYQAASGSDFGLDQFIRDARTCIMHARTVEETYTMLRLKFYGYRPDYSL